MVFPFRVKRWVAGRKLGLPETDKKTLKSGMTLPKFGNKPRHGSF
jgi:hypothetical protein